MAVKKHGAEKIFRERIGFRGVSGLIGLPGAVGSYDGHVRSCLDGGIYTVLV